jgi:hypothetical protein
MEAGRIIKGRERAQIDRLSTDMWPEHWQEMQTESLLDPGGIWWERAIRVHEPPLPSLAPQRNGTSDVENADASQVALLLMGR